MHPDCSPLHLLAPACAREKATPPPHESRLSILVSSAFPLFLFLCCLPAECLKHPPNHCLLFSVVSLCFLTGMPFHIILRSSPNVAHISLEFSTRDALFTVGLDCGFPSAVMSTFFSPSLFCTGVGSLEFDSLTPPHFWRSVFSCPLMFFPPQLDPPTLHFLFPRLPIFTAFPLFFFSSLSPGESLSPSSHSVKRLFPPFQALPFFYWLVASLLIFAFCFTMIFHVRFSLFSLTCCSFFFFCPPHPPFLVPLDIFFLKLAIDFSSLLAIVIPTSFFPRDRL